MRPLQVDLCFFLISGLFVLLLKGISGKTLIGLSQNL